MDLAHKVSFIKCLNLGNDSRGFEVLPARTYGFKQHVTAKHIALPKPCR